HMAFGLEVEEQPQLVGVVILVGGTLADGQRSGLAVLGLVAGLDALGVDAVRFHGKMPPCKNKRAICPRQIALRIQRQEARIVKAAWASSWKLEYSQPAPRFAQFLLFYALLASMSRAAGAQSPGQWVTGRRRPALLPIRARLRPVLRPPAHGARLWPLRRPSSP